MVIKRLSATNFRSFEHLDVELGAFNVLIGPNASGKSNLVQCLKFLRDLAREGLDNAVSMQGGGEYFRNINLSASAPSSLEVVLNRSFRTQVGQTEDGKWVEAVADEATYGLVLEFSDNGADFEVVEEKVVLRCDFRKYTSREHVRAFATGETLAGIPAGSGEVTFSNHRGKLEFDTTFPGRLDSGKVPASAGVWGSSSVEDKLPPNRSFLRYIPELRGIESIFGGIAVYDFDPKLAKRAVPLNGRKNLEEDGSNLAIVLRDILEDEDRKREFSNLLRDLMPFVADLGVERFLDRSLLFNLREEYGESPFPAFLLSDGTVGMTALIAALYFEENPLVVVEEPERNIHPYLISRVVSMLEDASKEKQVIVTTHSPQVVESAGLENLLLVSRGRDGFSRVTRPSERREVQVFLENEIGLQDLYAQNLLGA
jgi:predicted ATPase